jgi:hypothetical protein
VRLSACIAVAALLLLGGCQAPPPPPPPAGPVLPVPPHAPPAPAQPRERATWRFVAAPGMCIAQAIGPTAQLRVALRAGHPMVLTLSAPPAVLDGPATPGALRFEGPAGTWSAVATIGPGALAVAVEPLNDQAVGRVSLLLAGGLLEPVGAGTALPALNLPSAHGAGRNWFACARGLLF